MNEPDPLVQIIERSDNFPCTVSGWLWYCDAHDTHGTADTEEEADCMAEYHQEYFIQADGEADCFVHTWERKEP